MQKMSMNIDFKIRSTDIEKLQYNLRINILKFRSQINTLRIHYIKKIYILYCGK